MDSELLTVEFELNRRQLKSFVLRMTANREEAEDIVQDTYLRSVEKMKSFRGESTLKTWLFTIASNLAKDRLRKLKRWPENVTDLCRTEAMANPQFFSEAMHIRETSEQGKFEIREHIAFCFTCISKSLPLEQHLCLLLKEVYEFKVSEICQILDVTEAMTKYYLHTARAKMVSIFDGRCALISKQGTCHQCTELNGIFNPEQKAQEELVKIEMVRLAESADKQHLLDLRMQILRGIDPFESGAAELQLHHLQHNRQVIEKYLEKNAD